MTTRPKGSITAQPAGQSKRAKSVTGTSGVYFVAYRLSAMDYIVALTPEGTPGVDLMAFSRKSGKAVSVQVKTATNAARKRREGLRLIWQLGSKAPEFRNKDVFYAFVDMKGRAADKPRPRENPDVFIVPAGWVTDRKHRNIYSPEELASLNTFPKRSKEPNRFFFALYARGQKKWKEKWELITGKLGKAL